MGAILEFLLARAKERTTWIGLIGIILGVVGLEATAVQTEQLAGSLTAIVGTILALMPERKPG